MVFYVICGVLLAYLMGAIPTSVWVGRKWYGKDVRNFGSGNAGATNTFRVLGKKAGVVVLLFDVFKGWAGTSLAWGLLYLELIHAEHLVLYQILMGMAAVLGHIFPIYVGFKGGKGIATLLGMAIGLHPAVTGISIVVFLVVLLLTHYVSVGSMSAALCFPLCFLLPPFQQEQPYLLVFGLVVFLLVIYTHRKNIGRLRKGVENKTYLR